MENINAVLQRYEFGSHFPEQLRPSENLIRKLERTIGTELPYDYRLFLQQHGCIGPSIEIDVPVTGHNKKFAFSFFFGFFPHDPEKGYMALDLTNVYLNMRPQIGEEYFPIGNGEAMNLFCMKLSNEQKGSVYLWTDNFEKDAERAQSGIFHDDEMKLYYLAPDFVSFVGLFQKSIWKK
jgi:hypothetical protein